MAGSRLGSHIGSRATGPLEDGRTVAKISTAAVISLIEDIGTLDTEVQPARNGR